MDGALRPTEAVSLSAGIAPAGAKLELTPSAPLSFRLAQEMEPEGHAYSNVCYTFHALTIGQIFASVGQRDRALFRIAKASSVIAAA